MSREFLSTSSEWTFELIQKYDEVIAGISADFGLDTFPVQLEIINSEQMIDVYSAVGMPLGYSHWSFGKEFISTEKKYRHGLRNLAYEIVINSNPCIAYLLEENTMMMQAMIIAHACYGHNSFFKCNYLFKTWTDPDSIIDYLVFAKKYIRQCEEQHGQENVEQLLDSCHALMNHGVNRYKRPPQMSIFEERARQKSREAYLQSQVNDLWRTIPDQKTAEEKIAAQVVHFPTEPEENILYFLEKHSPLLEPWQREVIRITRKIAQYFYPQRQTKVMNEGWASFWHYTIMHELYDRGYVNDNFMLEFVHLHSNLLTQPEFYQPGFSGINPYTLGFNMFIDLRRICEDPTDEDKEWFPDIAGTPWQETLDFAMRNFKDDSFIAQFLSPRLIRRFKLFSLLDDDTQSDIVVSAIHDEKGYKHVREMLAMQYDISNIQPNIEITDADIIGDRQLTLKHTMYKNTPLNDDANEVVKHLHRLWGYPVKLESINDKEEITKTYQCPLAPSTKESEKKRDK